MSPGHARVMSSGCPGRAADPRLPISPADADDRFYAGPGTRLVPEGVANLGRPARHRALAPTAEGCSGEGRVRLRDHRRRATMRQVRDGGGSRCPSIPGRLAIRSAQPPSILPGALRAPGLGAGRGTTPASPGRSSALGRGVWSDHTPDFLGVRRWRESYLAFAPTIRTDADRSPPVRRETPRSGVTLGVTQPRAMSSDIQ
jgi:hypothetical protein